MSGPCEARGRSTRASASPSGGGHLWPHRSTIPGRAFAAVNLVRDVGQGQPYERTLIEGPAQPAASFAAAFAARLNSRTFVSDSGLTMSATDRNEPSSP